MSAFPSDLFEAEIRRLAAERPNHIHKDACEYVKDGVGSCLLGQALENIGIDLDPLSGSLNGEEIDDVAKWLGWEIDPLVLAWAFKVQEHQDSEYPWGKAVAIADGREID
jgi:hypothetical protein